MTEALRVGIVTVTYDSSEVLPAFLRSLEAQTHTDFLLFAVDNASKDDSVALLQGWSDSRCRVLANAGNVGVAAGNNQGIRAAQEAGCSHVLLLNNDVEFEAALIETLLDGLSRHDAAMVTPKILYFDDPSRIWMAGGHWEWWAGYRCVHTGENEVDRGQYDVAQRIQYAPTCCVLIERGVFDRIGLMDERYFVYSDDLDFMYRAFRAGEALVYLPEVTLLHKVGGLTGGATSPFGIRFGTRNRLFFLLKHRGFLLTLPWAAFCQVYWGLQLVMRRHDLRWYRLKQAAFVEAFRMPRGE